jgi:hypothetical protein
MFCNESLQLSLSLRILGSHVAHKVNDAVGVSPLVVVPGHNLEKALLVGKVVLQGGLGVVDGAAVIVDEVGAHELLLSEAEDVLKVCGGGLLQGGIDLLDARVLVGAEGEVNHRDIGGGDTEGHTGELTLGDGQHLTNGASGASGARDDILGRSAPTTPVLDRHAIDGLLGGGVGVDGGHEAGLDSEALLGENVDEGGEAVGGARRVGDNVVLAGVVLLVVDAHDNRLGTAGSGGGNDDLLGPALNVALSSVLAGEETSGLNDVLDAELAPREVSGVAHSLDTEDLLAVDDNDVILLLGRIALRRADSVLELAVNRVILHLVRKVVSVSAHVDDGNDLNLLTEESLICDGLEDHATNATEAIDANLDGHNVDCLCAPH